jgi:hypothetical protein
MELPVAAGQSKKGIAKWVWEIFRVVDKWKVGGGDWGIW